MSSSILPGYPLPWRILDQPEDQSEDSHSDRYIYSADGEWMVACDSGDLAKRIVSCVNACDGMENPSVTIDVLKEDSKRLDKLEELYAGSGEEWKAFMRLACQYGFRRALAMWEKQKR
jgi:hypothetical protein